MNYLDMGSFFMLFIKRVNKRKEDLNIIDVGVMERWKRVFFRNRVESLGSYLFGAVCYKNET